MKRFWNRIKQFVFYPEEDRIYLWILIGPLFLTLLILPTLHVYKPLQLVFALGSLSLSWMISIMFGLQVLSIAQKMRELEGQVEQFDAEKGRLKDTHAYEIEASKGTIDSLYVQMDELSVELASVKSEKNTQFIEIEKLKVELEQSLQNVNLVEEELVQLKDRFRSVNSELKVYKASSFTRYEVKHMVDELNRYRIKEKQSQLLQQ